MSKMVGLSLTFLLIILLILFYLILAPIQADTEGVRYLIGMSQCNLGEPWRIQMNSDIAAAAELYDDVKVIFTDASESNEKQIEDVRNLMELGIDLLIISPLESEPLTPIITEVYGQIPVIVLDRKTTNDAYTLFIAADNREIGVQAGEYVKALLGEQGGNVVELYGLPGSSPAGERSEGFRSSIADRPDIRIVHTIVADWLRDPAQDQFAEYLASEDAQPIDVVYSHNDPMALGAYRAAEELGLQNDIVFIGIDGLIEGEEAGINLVRRGVIDITYIYPNGGQEAVEYARRILGGEVFEEKQVVLPHQWVDASNWEAYLDAAG